MQWLFRRNNAGQPCCWGVELNNNSIVVQYGIVGKTIRQEKYIVTQKDGLKEVQSRINSKLKEGYMFANEIRDDNTVNEFPSLDYLNNYLPHDRSNNNNDVLLAMLAKTYNSNLWKKYSLMLGQWKINGLRCFISAYQDNDIFAFVRLRFQSREGEIWTSLDNLEDYLLSVLPKELLDLMVNEHFVLDGEVYLPGYSINEINHFVKNKSDDKNKLLQFWCYDLAIADMTQEHRFNILDNYLWKHRFIFISKDVHLNNQNRLVYLPYVDITNDNEAIKYRDEFIKNGFEGLILRNPYAEYQFGKRRVGFLTKYKDKTDGRFVIIDIQKEQKRDLPIITCRNDINNETFDTRFSYPHERQKEILDNKEKYIGRNVFITFGERSGITNCPFHIREVYLID